VKVAKTYRGQAAAGQTVTLAQTGGGTIGFSEDSPTYKVGERYVLLLRPGRPNMYRIIAPEGRLRITAQGLIEPMKVADPNNPALADLRGGKPLAVFEQLLALPYVQPIQPGGPCGPPDYRVTELSAPPGITLTAGRIHGGAPHRPLPIDL